MNLKTRLAANIAKDFKLEQFSPLDSLSVLYLNLIESYIDEIQVFLMLMEF